MPGCKRYTFEDASDFMFMCPKCGRPLQPFDNEGIIKALEGRIRRIEEELRITR
jgi:transcription initiation factor IIE alpha subunit